MGQRQKPSLYCLPASHFLYHLFDCKVIFLGGHTGLSSFLPGTSCTRVVLHPVFSTSFRSREFSRAPFPIKIPFHKTAFANSLSVLKSTGLSSLVHCFCSLLSWNARALLMCDLFHSDYLPQQPQPLIQFSHINQQQTTSHQVQLHTPHVTAAKSCSLSTKLQGWATHCNCLLHTYLGQFPVLWGVSYRSYRHHFPTFPAARRDLVQGISSLQLKKDSCGSAIRLLISMQAIPLGARNQLKCFGSGLSPTPSKP